MKQWKTLHQLLVVLALGTVVTACGFHLRGSIPLPDGIKYMFVEAPEGSFKDKLEEMLENGGAEIASSRASASVVLNVLTAEPSRRVGTLDERGKADSYNLRFKVKYVLQDPEGEEIREASLSESRRYNFDPDFVIETEAEEEELQKDMEESIGLRIVRQLSSITDYPPTEEEKAEDKE